MEFEAPTLKGALSKAVAKYKKPIKKTYSKPQSGYRPIRFQIPQGIPQQSRAQQVQGAISDFRRNYMLMREANRQGADKYFHCVANCQASRRGPHGEAMARTLSNAREWSQWVDNNLGGADEAADREANRTGREGARRNPGATCHTICRDLMPSGLPPRYWSD